jgi:hypothetical protein
VEANTHVSKQLKGTGKLVESKITQLPMRLCFYFDAETKVRVPAILFLEKKTKKKKQWL